MQANALSQLPQVFALPSTFVNGRLETTWPSSVEHGAVVGELVMRLRSYVRRHELGIVLTAGTGFVLSQDPLTVRAPDVSFVSQARMEALPHLQGYFPGAPDLAVEVVSTTDGAGWLEEQVDGYFRAGARQVWQIFPQLREVVVQHGSRGIILKAADTLDGGALLPGFACPVAELFE